MWVSLLAVIACASACLGHIGLVGKELRLGLWPMVMSSSLLVVFFYGFAWSSLNAYVRCRQLQLAGSCVFTLWLSSDNDSVVAFDIWNKQVHLKFHVSLMLVRFVSSIGRGDVNYKLLQLAVTIFVWLPMGEHSGVLALLTVCD